MGVFYTDGSAHPNPGPGGFGVVEVIDGDKVLLAHTRQTQEETTNNREELKAIVWVMLMEGQYYNSPKATPIVYSDSAYAVNTLNEWMFNWAKNGWVKSDNKIPENLDLIQAYYDHYQKGFRIDLRKIKGHDGHKWNELADKLATGKITPEEAKKNWQ